MSGRKCGNCRHYETSPIWRSGWCRNPRLYSPQESHLVNQDALECAHRVGNYWEPIEVEEALPDAVGSRARRGRIHPLRLFGPQPRLLAATASVGGTGGSGTGPLRPPRAASGGGGTGGYDVSERYVSRPADSGQGRDPRGATGAAGAYAGPERPVQPGGTPGQERPVSYQPEERYWTDYLRIALPVVGLLLMLGLFWFWATSLIGDEDDDDPANLAANVATATATAVPQAPATTETTGGAPAGNTGAGETPTVPLGDSGSTEGNTDPAPANEANGEETVAVDEGADTGEASDEEPADAESPVCDDGDFCTGVFAEVTSDGVNLREEPGLDGAVVDQLSTGAEVVITGDPQELDDFTWVPVETDLGDGYVTTDFLQRTN